jgi:hypothetical protein
MADSVHNISQGYAITMRCVDAELICYGLYNETSTNLYQ